MDPCQFPLGLPAVEGVEQVPAKYEGQRLNGCRTGRELTRCFTHVPGRCQPKWKRAYIASVPIFLCTIAVMHAYECVSGNKSGACRRTWIPKRLASILIIIAIIVIIEVILLSIIHLIASKCKKWTLISIIAIIDAHVQ
jgi:hypothetical protein